MKSKRLLMAAAAFMLLANAAEAQDKNARALLSYSFIEAQGGVQLTSTDAKMDKLMTPTAALSFGHYFTPVVGARLHVNAWEAKSGFSAMDKYYKWKYVTPDLDLLLNLTNLFSRSKTGSHPLNVILLGGVGLNYAWDNDELKNLGLESNLTPLAWDKNRLSHNLRAGLRVETNVTKPLGLSLEVNANSLSDRFNSKTNDADDWQFTAMLGLSFRFGHKYKPLRHLVKKPVEIVETVEVDEPTTIMVVEKRPKEEVKQKKIEKAVFFKISQSNADAAKGINDAVKEVADLMKTMGDTKFTVTGYADKGTGSAAINKKYAQKRAESVRDLLVKEHGVDAARLVVDSKGDTVQPFAENDKNRCVIVTGEGMVKEITYEEVEVEKPTTKKVKKQQTRTVEVEEWVED
jgi:outer membrane protein OmpA-like peptidoglycan-associated protein